jgi:hypothetical protein
MLCALAAVPAAAQVTVKDPWVRASAPGQKIAAAYMKLESAAPASIVGASSPVGKAELHVTERQGEVMRMRPVGKIAIAPGKPVEFKPGSYHIMLVDLKNPVKPGDVVPITLEVEGKDGKREAVAVEAPVKPLAGAGAGGHGGMHMDMDMKR